MGFVRYVSSKTVIFIVVFVFFVVRAKTVEIPLVLMRHFDVQAFSLGTGVKVQEQVIPDSYPCNLLKKYTG